MKKYYPLFIIFIGMILTHLFFTLMIYRSDLALHHDVMLIVNAGYLPVPNAHILPSLQRVSTALKGAVFYTLTVGIVLPFLVYLAACAWDRGYRRNRVFLMALSGFVIFCMVMLNRHGFNPIVTFWFLSVYIIVFKLTIYILDKVQTRLSPKRLVTHLALLAVLGAAWMNAPGVTDLSLSVRDHLLLSNPVGERITAFYYRYSPYPTNAYKELRKRQLKTCKIDGDVANAVQHRMETTLLRYDYLPLDTEAETDLAIRIQEDRLSFSVSDRTVLKTDIAGFLQSPATILNRVSSRSDRNDFTRRFLAFSLVYGIPIVLYASIFSVFQFFFNRIPSPVSGFWLSAAGCLVVGIAALIGIRAMAFSAIPATELKSALESDDPDIRVAALRTISRQNLDPSEYLDDDLAAEPAYVPERIWWTVSLGNATAPEARELLLQLLDDPHPLVACKAYSAIAKREYRPGVPIIIEKLGTSRQWYVQGYAYHALRSLGWKQKASS